MAATLRALLDANLFISYLLSRSQRSSAVGTILHAASAGAFLLLYAPEIAEEIERTVADRPHLTTRITPSDIDGLNRSRSAVATVLPRLSVPIPRIVRDPQDDDLVAHAILARADFLVSRETRTCSTSAEWTASGSSIRPAS